MSNKKIKILVTGATGVIGSSLVNFLLKNGYQVQVLIRNKDISNIFDEPIQIIIGDITDKNALLEATNGVDWVFHLAAKLHINNPSPEILSEYERINVEGTRLLVKSSIDNGIKRIIFFSTINVYGPSKKGIIFSENSNLNPISLYAKTKLKGEQIVLNARGKQNDKPIGVVLRCAAVYGPGMKGNYKSLLKALKLGLFLPVGDGKNRRTLVYIKDVLNAALIAAKHPNAPGCIYNITDGNIYTFNHIIKIICNALGKSIPRYHLSINHIRFLTKIIEKCFKLINKNAPINQLLIDKLIEDVAVSGDKIKHELGFKPRYDLKTGWEDTILKI